MLGLLGVRVTVCVLSPSSAARASRRGPFGPNHTSLLLAMFPTRIASGSRSVWKLPYTPAIANLREHAESKKPIKTMERSADIIPAWKGCVQLLLLLLVICPRPAILFLAEQRSDPWLTFSLLAVRLIFAVHTGKTVRSLLVSSAAQLRR